MGQASPTSGHTLEKGTNEVWASEVSCDRSLQGKHAPAPLPNVRAEPRRDQRSHRAVGSSARLAGHIPTLFSSDVFRRLSSKIEHQTRLAGNRDDQPWNAVALAKKAILVRVNLDVNIRMRRIVLLRLETCPCVEKLSSRTVFAVDRRSTAPSLSVGRRSQMDPP